MTRRGGAVLRLLATTVLLPLVLVALGIWEMRRGAVDAEEAVIAQARAAKAVAALEARIVPGRPFDPGLRYSRNGRSYVGELALAEARDELRSAEGNVVLARVRAYMPPFVVWPAAAVAGLSLLVLTTGAVLAWRGRSSREALVRGFSFVRRALPPILGAQVVMAAVAVVAATGFEVSALLFASDISGGEMKLLLLALLFMGVCLWVAVSAVLGLRRALTAFEPDPLPILGRPVSREEAPGLWRMVDGLADRLRALRPDQVVVGLTGGFFVASGPKLLVPGGEGGDAALTGRTLYLPLPALAMLRGDETAAVVAHELAHFSGEDTEYSLRFLPIYAGVERSLDAVAAAGGGSTPFLLRPALALGVFVLEGFHRAVRHWSRLREFAADAAGAGATSADASARALLRVPVLRPPVEDALDAAARDPDAAPPDLVADAVRRAAETPPTDSWRGLDEGEPHPTDTHPPTRARLEALGRSPYALSPTEAALADAGGTGEHLARLGDLFADPAGLCRDATADFLAVVRGNRQAYRNALEATAAAVEPGEVVLRENLRGGGIFIVCFGLFFASIGLALAILDPGGLDTVMWGLVGLAVVVGTGFAVWGAVLLRRDGRPFLVLRPEEVAVPGLDVPIAWRHVVQLDVAMTGKGATTTFTLASSAPFPKRVPGGRRVKADPGRRVVTVTAVIPRGMKPDAFVELLGRYRAAAEARRRLAAGETTAEADPWVG